MKCLSLRQPWATLIVHGFTSYDVRSWCTAHRGLLAIHASQRLNDDFVEVCRRAPIRRALESAGYESMFDLPRGRILGVVELIECEAVPGLEIAGRLRAECESDHRTGRFIWKLTRGASSA